MPRVLAILTAVVFAASTALAQSYTCTAPYTQQTFTNASAAGTVTGTIQSFQIPSSQMIVDALGAQGGTGVNGGGGGAEVVATFSTTPLQTLCVVAGAQGGSAGNGAAGGGGGSFVYTITSGTCASNLGNVNTGFQPMLLVAAGGGGGSGTGTAGGSGIAPANAGTSGASAGSAGDQNGGAGGSNGSGGGAVVNSGGGGGLASGGTTANGVPGGQSFIAGAGGGFFPAFANGGFGGGGAAAAPGGGGGGFAGGGAGGNAVSNGGGGGGGSFSATNPMTPYTQSGVHGGNGLVSVCFAPPATHFSVTAPASSPAGALLGFTVTALDPSNNVVPTYNGTVHFTSTDGAATLPADTTLTNGTASLSATLHTTGNQTITATDTAMSVVTGASNTITVSAGPATHFTVSAPATAAAGTPVNVTVTALDQWNNTATGYSGTVHFTSTDVNANLPADSPLTNGTGIFSATLHTSGSQTVTATDTISSSITGMSGHITVGAGVVTSLGVVAPASATAGAAINFGVTALDASNNTVTSYTGTVHFSSSDGSATLPANATLTNGVGSFSATLRTSGNQSITATDTVTSSVTGTSGAIAVNIVPGAITLLGSSVCPAASNWSNPACWDLNRAPATGDNVSISATSQLSTNDDLGAAVVLNALTISSATGAVTITGGPIALGSGGTLTDSLAAAGTDTLPGLTLAGPATVTVSASGRILNISGAFAGGFQLTKTGAGTLQFSGASPSGGGVQVNGGTLNVTGVLGGSPVVVANGGTLTGTGTVPSIAVQSGGTLSGNLTAPGGTIFAAGSTFNVTITSATVYTQLNGGTTNLSAGPTLTVTLAGTYTPSAGTVFTLVPGTVTGTFSTLPDGSTVSAGRANFRLNYSGVKLTTLAAGVPALSTRALGLLGALLAGLAMWMLFRRAALQAS